MGHNEFQDTTDVTMQYENKPLIPSRKDCKVPTVTRDREEKMAANHDGNRGNRTPKKDVSRTYLQAE